MVESISSEKPKQLEIKRWYFPVQSIGNEYALVVLRLNGWDFATDRRWVDLRIAIDSEVKKAVISGALRVNRGTNGPLMEPGEAAYINGSVSLQRFCDWAPIVVDDCPRDARQLAASFGFSLTGVAPSSPSPAASSEPQAAPGATGDALTPAKPVQRTAAQDATILCELKKQGYDPQALPKNPDGKPGAKAAVRTALSKNPLFTGKTVFNKAWVRLTAHEDIVIQD